MYSPPEQGLLVPLGMNIFCLSVVKSHWGAGMGGIGRGKGGVEITSNALQYWPVG
jgi:hypothetical protein